MASVLLLACTREAVCDDVVATYGDLFNDHVEITFQAAPDKGNPLYDFPLLVRLSEGSPEGFSYARVDSLGQDFRFVSVEGAVSNAVPYEVDTWNTNGVSLLWVKVPKYSAKSDLKLVMYWAPDDPTELPTNDARAVWNGYAGVWHMNGTGAESTTNMIDGAFGSKTATQVGVIGSALGTRNSGPNGPILQIPSGTLVDDLAGNAYTISAWLNVNSIAGGPWLYSARATQEDDAFGAKFVTDAGGIALELHADGSTSDGPGSKRFLSSQWVHIAVVCRTNDKHTVYLNGSEFYSPSNAREDKAGAGGFAFGGLVGDSASGTLNGDLDDVRVYPGALKPAWLTNEYAQVVSSDCVAFSNFYSTGKSVYVQKGKEKEAGDDPAPGALDEVSPDNYAGQATFVPGELGADDKLTDFIMMIKVWQGSPAGFDPRNLPFGSDDIRFFDDQGNVLNFEIDTWAPQGESVFWVKIPKLTRSSRVIMCWGLKEGMTLPDVDPYDVWSAYAGVWHMSDETDSTGNGATATFGTNAVLQLGVAGNAAGTMIQGQKGAILDIETTGLIDSLTNEAFTVSGWVYLNREALKYGALFSRATASDSAWGAQFCGGTSGDYSELAVQSGSSSFTNDVEIDVEEWTKFDFVYAADRLQIYIGGEKVGESAQARSILNGSSGKLSVGGFVSAAEGVLGAYTLNGYIDEFRLRSGTLSDLEREMDAAQCGDDEFYTRNPATWDSTAVLQNRWKEYPTATKTEWDEGDDPAEFTLGEPWYGESVLSYQDRATSEPLLEMPTVAGDYRAIFTVAQTNSSSYTFSSLRYEIDFRIRMHRPTHKIGTENDRILLLNNDQSVSDGKVGVQSYSDSVAFPGRPYWVHDVDTGYDYTSTSLYYNFCGGMRHTYYARGETEERKRLWDLLDVRYGNTYNNADNVFEETGDWEEWDDGLDPGMNYLSWNPKGGSLVDDGLAIEGWHEYAAQAVMCNTLTASINSGLYTNGIGTIYFDCVNSHTDDATNGYYQLVVEMATNALTKSDYPVPYGIPTDDAIAATHEEWDAEAGEYVTVVHEPYKFADWKPLEMRVRVVNGAMPEEDAFTTNVLTLALAGGGSYTNFYRVYVPVDFIGNARFRIRRTAINPDYTMSTDVHSLILVDNVICSEPTDRVRILPRGFYDTTKIKRETVGYEGAFTPSYPSVNDQTLYARAVALTSSGEKLAPEFLSSVTMHYRWRYLNQQVTDWLTVDFDRLTMTSVEPISWPLISGDIEYWYDAYQTGEYYEYADYSGLGLGLPGYSEEMNSVEGRSPTYDETTERGDWFTRIRDGKSTYGNIKLYVRRGETAPVEEVEMFVARDQVWRGCMLATNAIEDGIYFRFAVCNKQDDTLEDFQFNTNYWYLAEAQETMPVTGSVIAGTTNDWGRVPWDGATQHVMFQLDESTRALTVVHADWQDFNGWNDAHGAYFVGTSTDDVTKRGVSAGQREYDCVATNLWEEDFSTNQYWIETFSPGPTSQEYPPYVHFKSTTSPNGFGVGDGMWVYGAYAYAGKDSATDPQYALQMTGQGYGYAQMVSPIVEPRGIESVKFNARIAQAISPADFVYYKGSKSESALYLDDYTFLTRVAFDLNANSNFTGNATMSLAAFYQPGESCYEARWEQLSGNIEDGTGTILGPSPRGQRLALYRWKFEGQAWKATELYAATNSGSVYSWNTSVSPSAIPQAHSITNGLMPFYVGAYAASAYTLVITAVHIPGGTKAADNVKGNTADATLSYLASEKGWLYLVYKDQSSERLTCGTYGTLAANCEGYFVRPQYHPGLASWETTDAKTRALATQVYPKSTSVSATASFRNTARECVTDLAASRWRVTNGRMDSFYQTVSDNYNGFNAAVVTQTVDVFTAPLGTTSWSTDPVASCTLTGFGKPGILQGVTNNLWTTDDLSIRIQAGGTTEDVRTDVIVDNIQISQWAGQNWLGRTETERNQGGRTNFVYTYGWVTDGALQLSPRRTPKGEPCSLRVPLCDGQTQNKWTRGVGLGNFAIRCRNVQTNANLLVQIATNGVSTLNLLALTEAPWSDSRWTTVTNWDYTALTENEGVVECSLGLHGVIGTLRVIASNDWDAVHAATDPTAFGSVDIVEALFRDEPALDKGCWWGFNIRTIGDVSDVEQRMYLPDNPLRSPNEYPYLGEIGRSLALNNSVTEGCDPDEVAKASNPYTAHMPFLQTPTFSSNIVGEVSFRARKYSLMKGSQCAEVTLYGTRSANVDSLKDKDWDELNVFIVSNTTFETYRFKVNASDAYRAFRFAVTGVDGVDWPGHEPICGDEPVRVILDDVLVSEAVRARLAFRNVGAFRHSLSKTTYVPDVPSTYEQPICKEGWGVQAEIYPAMLGEEIDTTVKPRVRLHYYKGLSPWGYSNWKSKATSGWMTLATDTNNFYRSSATDSPDTVIPMADSLEYVQYMLEVVYSVVNSETGFRSVATNWLESTDWSVPSWYYPIDYNATRGGGDPEKFSAFAIIDEIAPGWAWINEINIFGMFNSNYSNTDMKKQFVEIAKPVEYSLEGWSLRMLSATTPRSITSSVTTNEVAVFGFGVSAEKTSPKASNMSFVVVGNPKTELSRAKGEYDGAWSFAKTDSVFNYNRSDKNYYLAAWEPVAIQLVRPSGIIEHEVAVLGTNDWSASSQWAHSSSNLVNILKTANPNATFFSLPDDNAASTKSVGVFDSRGEAAKWWNNTMKLTPGNINENQVIDPTHPTPGGELIMIFASVDTSFGHIRQTVGAGTNTTEAQSISLACGSETGLDIVYTVDPWCELGEVKETEDKKARIPIIVTNGVRRYTVNVAKGATKNVTVVASAAVDSRLRKYGLDESNRYTPAVLHWLQQGVTLNGPFYDTESCEVRLAKFLALSGQVVTNMTLTQMYWLDMDPTAGEMYFRAGMVRPPSQVVTREPTYDPQSDPKAYTNLRMGVYMSISNGNDHASRNGQSVWAPYVLRGLEEGELSWNYFPNSQSAGAWTSETFKVTGFLNSGLSSVTNMTAWIPLRYFVFKEDSFDSNYEAEIDIDDPFSTMSPAYAGGWSRWVKEENHGVKPPVYLSWNIDERLQPLTVEILAPTNRLDGTGQ